MTDHEILNKYIDLESSCITKEEKKEVMEMCCISIKKHLV